MNLKTTLGLLVLVLIVGVVFAFAPWLGKKVGLAPKDVTPVSAASCQRKSSDGCAGLPSYMTMADPVSSAAIGSIV